MTWKTREKEDELRNRRKLRRQSRRNTGVPVGSERDDWEEEERQDGWN